MTEIKSVFVVKDGGSLIIHCENNDKYIYDFSFSSKTKGTLLKYKGINDKEYVNETKEYLFLMSLKDYSERNFIYVDRVKDLLEIKKNIIRKYRINKFISIVN